jgi:hypothetical protein
MGNNKSKPTPKPSLDRILTEVLLNVSTTLNKKVEILKTHEKSLLENLNSGIYSMDYLRSNGELGVHHFKSVQAYKKLIQHLQFLKDSTDVLFSAQTQPNLLQPYTTAINSAIWSTNKLNLAAITEFNNMINDQFGHQHILLAASGINVDESLIKLVIYNGVLEFERAMYLESFLSRNNFE